MPTKKTTRKPTLRQDCEAVGAALPDLDGTLLTRITALAGKSLNTDIENSVRIYPDGTHVCLSCGFPAPVAFSKCPNCGRELSPADGKLIKKDTGLRWISVLTKRKGKLGTYVIQRQFTVDVRLSNEPYHHINTYIHEVYRNFVAEDGTLTTFKRGLNPFPQYCINPFNTDRPLKYTPKYTNRYNEPPSFCEIDWNEAINERLLTEIRRRFDIYKKIRKK